MHKTTLATVLFLGVLPALAACGGAGDGSADPTAATTSAATLSDSATLSGVGTFAIDSAAFQATISGRAGTWTSGLLEDQWAGRLLASLEIDMPGRAYVLSGVRVVSSQESAPQNEALSAFTLSFASLSVPSTPAVSAGGTPWVTITGIGSFPVDSARLQTTITAPTGSWAPAVYKDNVRGYSIATAQLALQSPSRTYTLSQAAVSGFTTSSESTTFTLSFSNVTVQLPLAPPGVYRLP
jgi:hypothetical protein